MRDGVARVTVRDFQNHRFGAVHQRVHVVRRLEGFVGNLRRHLNQATLTRTVAHDAGVVGGVGGGRSVDLQRRQQGGVQGFNAARFQLRLQGDVVHLDVLIREFDDGGKNLCVHRAIEVLGGAEFLGEQGRLARQEHGSDQGLLRVDVVRRDAGRGGVGLLVVFVFVDVGHGDSQRG